MDPATLLAQIMLAMMNLELTKQQAALEGRTLNDAEIDQFRQGALAHEQALEEAIQRAKSEGR